MSNWQYISSSGAIMSSNIALALLAHLSLSCQATQVIPEARRIFKDRNIYDDVSETLDQRAFSIVKGEECMDCEELRLGSNFSTAPLPSRALVYNRCQAVQKYWHPSVHFIHFSFTGLTRPGRAHCCVWQRISATRTDLWWCGVDCLNCEASILRTRYW